VPEPAYQFTQDPNIVIDEQVASPPRVDAYSVAVYDILQLCPRPSMSVPAQRGWVVHNLVACGQYAGKELLIASRPGWCAAIECLIEPADAVRERHPHRHARPGANRSYASRVVCRPVEYLTTESSAKRIEALEPFLCVCFQFEWQNQTRGTEDVWILEVAYHCAQPPRVPAPHRHR
jgi:hypothetical protein